MLAALMVTILLVQLPSVLAFGVPGVEGSTLPGPTVDEPIITVGGGFLENGGQVPDPNVLFYSWTPEGGVAITDRGALVTIVDDDQGCNVLLSFQGTEGTGPIGRDPLPGKTNYLLGRDPSGWASGLTTFQEVLFEGLYPGIDLVYRLSEGRLKYDLVLHPGADASSIRVAVSGHQAMTIDAGGDLVIGTPVGTVRDSGLIAFYADAPDETVQSSFRLLGDDAYGFSLGEFDRERTVVIDPLVYSTYVGGTGHALAVPWAGVALDSQDRPVVAGYTNSTFFPTTPGSYDRSPGGGESDIFVFRLSAEGTELEWSTYVGGNGADYPYDIVLDRWDRPVIVGRTNSTDFPTKASAYRPTHTGPDQEGFILKLNPDGGSLYASTYLGGNDTDELVAVALWRGEGVYVAGNTKSLDLPTTPNAPFENHTGGTFDAFVAVMDPLMTGLVDMTYLGGTRWDMAADITVDDLYNVYISGETGSPDFPATNGTYQDFLMGGQDAFVVKLNPGMDNITWCTLLGGFADEIAEYVHVADNGSVTIAGYTDSPNLPTTNNSFQPVMEGSAEVFVTRFLPNGSGLEYSTFMGGMEWDQCDGMAVDDAGRVHLTGRTQSDADDNFPTMRGAFQEDRAGDWDAYIIKLEADGGSALYASYLGGTGEDAGTGLALNATGDAVIVGGTDSPAFPTTAGVHQTSRSGAVDVFVTKMDLFLDKEPPVAVPGTDMIIDQWDTVTFNGSGSTDNVGVVNWTWSFPYNGSEFVAYGPVMVFTFDLAGKYYVNLTVRDAVGLTGRRWVSVYARDLEDPVAIAPEDMVGQQHWTVTLDGGASHDNMGIGSYFWTFVYNGTDQNLSGEKVSFTFHDAGVYDITLTVVDTTGNIATDTVTVTIRDITDPVADAGPDLVVGQREIATFDATNSSDNVGIVNVTWQLVYAGAPISLYGNITTFSFDRAGIYDVILMVEDAMANRGFDRLRVTVKDTTPPVAVAGSDKEIDQGDIVNLDSSSSSDDVGITTWTWTITFMGNSTTFSGQKNSVTFVAAGLHTVLLNVSDAAGNWDTDSFNVAVRDIQPPVAEAGENVMVEMGQPVAFNGTASKDNAGIISYTWTFKEAGEDVTLTGPAPNHTFSKVGTYLVTLTVLDGSGLMAQDQMQVHILDSEAPVADAGISARVLLGGRVVFDGANSTDNVLIESYVWTFNYNLGLVELTGEDPSFVFELKGTYVVTLTVTDPSGNSHSDETTVVVYTDDEIGDGDGGGAASGGIFLWLLIIVVLVVVVVIILVMRTRGGGEDKDMGWAPTEEEHKERETSGPGEGVADDEEAGESDGDDGEGEEG